MKYVFSLVAGLALGVVLTVGGCGKKVETPATTVVDAGVVAESSVTDATPVVTPPAVLEQGKVEVKSEPVVVDKK